MSLVRGITAIHCWIWCCSYAQTQYNIYWMSMQSAVIFICLCMLWPSGFNIHRMMLLVTQIFIHGSVILLWGVYVPLLWSSSKQLLKKCNSRWVSFLYTAGIRTLKVQSAKCKVQNNENTLLALEGNTTGSHDYIKKRRVLILYCLHSIYSWFSHFKKLAVACMVYRQ